MKKKLKILAFMLLPFISFGQIRTVTDLGVESINYLKNVDGYNAWEKYHVTYVYDGNPFNDNLKSLSISFKGLKKMPFNIPTPDEKGHYFLTTTFVSINEFEEVFEGNIDKRNWFGVDFRKQIVISKSDLLPETISFDLNTEINEAFEFIFDNDKSTYLKIDSSNYKKVNSLDHELFLKLKKHNKVYIRASISVPVDILVIAEDDSETETLTYNKTYDCVINLKGMTAAINKYLNKQAPTEKNKSLYRVANGLSNVNPFNLDKYIDKFVLDAQTNHDIDLSYIYDRDKLILFKELDNETIAAAYRQDNDDSVLVLVDPENWYAANQAKRWYIIYHELGHDILNFEHGEGGEMMNERTSGKYTWNRLEKDKAAMFELFKTKP